jgi:hypothetical protein
MVGYELGWESARFCCSKAFRYDLQNDTNNRKLDEDVESGGGPGAPTPALSARRDSDLRALDVAYPLSLRHLEDMMAERGVSVDHSTVHRWAIKLLPVLEKAFRLRKRPVGKSWRIDETDIRIKGEWRDLYRAVDKDANIIDFLLHAHPSAADQFYDLTT